MFEWLLIKYTENDSLKAVILPSDEKTNVDVFYKALKAQGSFEITSISRDLLEDIPLSWAGVELNEHEMKAIEILLEPET